ncbi:MAG: Proton-translocating NADH-quinone oxidoreductase, chain L [candidate division Zixibacteria bacterium RBG-1]|nr:MAG: Proton-translocating NADH-quinone oxidoreductase, chain L [candidate division Zixibacteria bacterium RBG-1]OGC85605.1 MAG: hypothetical protein A2V73_04645 [candidate division Zixibacteria bacterium RBG_19FT_COMBO_42_43]
MNSNSILVFLVLLAPFWSTLVLTVVYPLRRSGKPAGIFSILCILGSLVFSLILLFSKNFDFSFNFSWLPSLSGPMAQVGFWYDKISGMMIIVVSLVALMVQIYSLGYLSSETKPSLGRYFLYQSLFAFSMLGLVLANNFLELFIFWELVGLCSYLLIGFWYHKPEAAKAAVKAFWVTRFGDIGLIIAIILLWNKTGTFDYQTIFSLVESGALEQSFLILISILIFLGAMGKSAQFPLHIWLPDAMEGPTPVSALIHAATMVAAGVYLVIRLFPFFQASPFTLNLIAYIGSFTALLGAVLASKQDDIKRVLAYSTVSQLGFMMAALGVGAWVASYFHLFTHAYFKALLFLAAGSVIHAVGSNSLSAMGKLAQKMKWTSMGFLFGALALSGVWPFSGFFSKDEILLGVITSGKIIPSIFLLLTTFLSGFYIFRVIFLAFFSTAKSQIHPHESPKVMLFPILILAALALSSGLIQQNFLNFLEETPTWHSFSALKVIVPAISLGLGILGIFLAWLFFQKQKKVPQVLALSLRPISKAIDNKFYLDNFYEFMYAQGMLLLSFLIGWIDRYLVDGMVNLAAWSTGRLGVLLRVFQTGKAQDYLIGIGLGVLILIIWIL